MKIAVTGKGGVGKTTFAATLARLYAEEGRHVLAADVDPDANLGLALGFSEEELDTIVPISKMRKLVEERTGAGPDNQYYKIESEGRRYSGCIRKSVQRSKTPGSWNSGDWRCRMCLPGTCDAQNELLTTWYFTEVM